MDDAAVRAFNWATLLDQFHTSPAGIAGLTDLQLSVLYFHKRDKHGSLVPPEPPAEAPEPVTAESRLRSIDQLLTLGLITPARADELREQVTADGERQA